MIRAIRISSGLAATPTDVRSELRSAVEGSSWDNAAEAQNWFERETGTLDPFSTLGVFPAHARQDTENSDGRTIAKHHTLVTHTRPNQLASETFLSQECGETLSGVLEL